MKIEIKNRWTGGVIVEGDFPSLAACVIDWLKKPNADLCDANLRGASLRGASLRGASLRGASLRGADLRGADLCDADLCGANLRDASLRDADLCDADLCGANLCGANLCGANLCGANLRDASLCGANLCDANLRDASLRDANLKVLRDDLWAVLSSNPAEVEGLRKAIAEGKIDGSTYNGECACLSGTLNKCAVAAGHEFDASGRNASRPIERFFLAISPGQTPDKSQFAKLALEWTDEWLAKVKGAFAK